MKQYTHISIRDAYAHKYRPECVRVLADFYWRVLLSAALVITILSLGYGFVELSAVTGDSGNTLAQNTNIIQLVPKLDRTQLQNTLDAFSNRGDQFNSLKTAPQKISDPSR